MCVALLTGLTGRHGPTGGVSVVKCSPAWISVVARHATPGYAETKQIKHTAARSSDRWKVTRMGAQLYLDPCKVRLSLRHQAARTMLRGDTHGATWPSTVRGFRAAHCLLCKRNGHQSCACAVHLSVIYDHKATAGSQPTPPTRRNPTPSCSALGLAAPAAHHSVGIWLPGSARFTEGSRRLGGCTTAAYTTKRPRLGE